MSRTESDGNGSAAVTMLSLPSSTVEQMSQPAVRDVITDSNPDLIVIPGQRNATAYAAVQDVATNCEIVHPQLADTTGGIQHYRFTERSGLYQADRGSPPAHSIDILAVQNQDLIHTVQQGIRTGNYQTAKQGATLLIVPELAVTRDRTSLSARLPAASTLGDLQIDCPELVTVLAGGQPADYSHDWNLQDREGTVPVVGLGATGQDRSQVGVYRCRQAGRVTPTVLNADAFGLQALPGVGDKTAGRLREAGYQRLEAIRHAATSDLVEINGITRTTAKRMQAQADVLESGEPLVLTNKTPVKTRDDRPPLCIDIETDGLSPTIIWQIGVYDPKTDTHHGFVETDDPTDPVSVLEDFIIWLLANHDDRTLLTWNGYDFDYRHIQMFLQRYLPEYVDAWEDCWKYDLYKWTIRDGNALLPGRTNRLGDVARGLGYEAADTGLTGAQTATAYQQYMQAPTDPAREPDWERHRQYCEDDCRALWHVYQAILSAPRRDVTDGGTGGTTGQQAGLTDFQS